MNLNKIEIQLGDITKTHVDVIVNAANNALSGGGGVDHAIHKAAGAELKEECKKIGRCPTGEARITKGYNLPSKFIIHTVGPVWQSGHKNEEHLLRNCYINSLNLAYENNLKSIAFPCISTGSYRFPKTLAAKIALSTTTKWLQSQETMEKVYFVCDNNNYREYLKIFDIYYF